jgi:alpha-mannosidase
MIKYYYMIKRFFAFTMMVAMLISASAQNIKMVSVQPTPCLKKEKDKLSQLYYLHTENKSKSAVKAHLQVQALAEKFDFDFPMIDTGNKLYNFFLPEVRSKSQATFIFTTGKDKQKIDQDLVPQKHWTIYLIQHSHTDIGYTELQNQISRNHAEYLDSVISYCRQTDNYPEGCRFMWNEEITWSTEQFINNRSSEQIKELSEWIKKGRIEIAGWYQQMSDLCSHEEIIRNLYYSNVLRKKLGCNIQSAMCDDINGFPWSCPQLFSKSGISYFSVNLNETRGKSPFDRSYPFYWKSPDGSRILLWNGEVYHYGNYGLQFHSDIYEAHLYFVNKTLLRMQERTNYPYDIVAYNISGYYKDNSEPNMAIADHVKAWYEKWEYPKIKLAVLSDFFNELESRYSSVIPEYSAAWPDYWTDGTASSAFETGINRITQPLIYSAEKISSIVSMINPNEKYPHDVLNEANRMSLLYSEHTWGAWCSISQPYAELTKGQWSIKSSYAYIAKKDADFSMVKGMNTLSRVISCNNANSIIVFNALSWNVTNWITMELPEIIIHNKEGFEVFDSRTKKKIPSQRTDNNHFMFIANEVPAIGYAVYFIKPSTKTNKELNPDNKRLTVFENKFFKLTFDSITGGISRLYDKELNVQLIDTASLYKLNQYIYENPDPADCHIDNINKCFNVLNRYSPEHADVRLKMNGEVAAIITVTSKPKMANSLTQEIIVYNTIKKIEFINNYDKIETTDPEAVYFSFPFNVPQGKFTQEIANGTMIPETEQLPGTSRDWMAVQQWLDVSNKNYSILFASIEAPMVQYGEINTGKWLEKLEINNQTVFSYAMNNYWGTNFKASQGGPHTFHFMINTCKGNLNKTGATRFGFEQFYPLTAQFVENTNAGKYPESYSFFNIDQNNIIIQAIKQAEDGNGFVVRMREICGKDTKGILSSPLLAQSKTAYLTNLLEDNQSSLPVSGGKIAVSLKPYEIITIKIKP